MIGGNIEVTIQKKTGFTKNGLGESVPKWENMITLKGFLDLSNGDSKHTCDTKFQDSTHIFVCDYTPIDRKTDDKRLTVNGAVYEIKLIDNPMELNEHLEIYLKYLG
jgi:SPP1 family predicted phage head-tail adaptor